MLRPHSPLWTYLSIAPNLLLLVVGYLIWKRGFARQFPAFLAFAIIGGLGELVVYGADIAPTLLVSEDGYLLVSWAVLVLEAILKVLVIGEVLSKLLIPYPSVSRLGRNLVSGFGAVLVLLAGVVVAGVVARFAHKSNGLISGYYPVTYGYRLLEHIVFVIELGLVVFLFLFAAYFHLSWDRLAFGILLGLGVSACVQLAAWAVVANASPFGHTRTLFDFLNMWTYHTCVLVWLYYVLVPQKVGTKSEVPCPKKICTSR